MVASSKYEIKTREADALRDAVASANKEKTVLEARNEALQKQLADARDAEAALAARVQTQEREIQRMSEELASARKNYEGTRITREQFISELLEKEKATGKRIQDLSARAQACEQALENLRKEAAARDSELAELAKNAGKPADNEALKRERDILLGRVERLTEERRQEDKRRDDRFAALSEAIGKASRDVTVTSLGPALRVVLPEKVLSAKGKTTLTEGGKKTIALVGKAAAEFPTASILVSAGGKKIAGEIRAALADAGKIPAERIPVKLYEKEKGAELLLLVP
jgi:DNA repair exonuclease SbcCD ATPase subunit